MRFLRITLPLLLFTLTAAACNAPGLVATPSPTLSQPATPTGLPAEPQVLSTEPPTMTAEPATVTSPPQQLRVAYTVDGDLWAVEPGSPPVQLTQSGLVVDFRISDDGQHIVYVQADQDFQRHELRGIGFSGGDDRSLLNQAALDALYPLEGFLHYRPGQLTMVPGTHQLLFNTIGVFDGPGLPKNNDLLRLDIDSGEVVQLLERGEGGDFTLSPDASQLAIVRPDSVGFADRDGGRPRPEVLTFPFVITYSEYFFYLEPVWVSDGVIAAVPAEDPFFGPEQGSFWHVPADGSEPLLLSSPQADLFVPQRTAPIVSPDGSRAIFFRRPDDAAPPQLWIYDLLDNEAQLYDQGPLAWHGWAPDSEHFAYGQEQGAGLTVGSVAGGPVPLGSGRSLRWIDAERYVWLAGAGSDWILTLGSLTGESMDLASISGAAGAIDFAD